MPVRSKEIQPFLDQKRYVTVLRAFEHEDEVLTGVPVALSKDFLILNEISEFYLYGFTIVPIKSMDEIHNDAADQFVEYILRTEGIMDKVKLPYTLNLENWKGIFDSLMATGLPVTIQAEDLDEDYFFIGKVQRVDNDAVWIHHFDSEGVLAETWDMIPFDSINKVGFDEPFANMLSKHLRSLN